MIATVHGFRAIQVAVIIDNSGPGCGIGTAVRM
jgi:hypothetical protein